MYLYKKQKHAVLSIAKSTFYQLLAKFVKRSLVFSVFLEAAAL